MRVTSPADLLARLPASIQQTPLALVIVELAERVAYLEGQVAELERARERRDWAVDARDP
jgi:hypothetical protein